MGRITCDQLDEIANIADQYGEGFIRMTVWQNLLIPGINDADVDAVKKRIEAMGLHWNATSARAGLVACTGSKGCKFALADTKGHAMIIASHLEETVEMDQPLNIHVTGCHNSCAQHYIGDIGLQGAACPVGDDMVEGYHIVVGGGYGSRGTVGRQLFDSVPFEHVPGIIEKILTAYLGNRNDESESFVNFAKRSSDQELISWGEFTPA